MDISTTLAAISTAKEFAALVIGRKIDSAVTDKAIELQNSIIALQSGLLEMQSQIQTLKNKNDELENKLSVVRNWEIEENENELFSPADGVYVMAPKVDSRLVWYCTNCWKNKEKSILQRIAQDYGGTTYECSACNSKIYDHSDYASIGV
ncbi:hypothetical protein SAMN02745729_13512 [Marinobacterium iners DSM 11526]|uniref:Uncharacterized protein n=2 Tax=Marinobacterium iners TaxID=48076 RepID=A0A1H4H9Y1_9GAMM|nr:hypothetical protein SAMN02745729_13512 [Marinobacterium iners DSM 11526]